MTGRKCRGNTAFLLVTCQFSKAWVEKASVVLGAAAVMAVIFLALDVNTVSDFVPNE